MTYCLLRPDCRFERYTALHVYGIDCDALKTGRPVLDVEDPVRITLSAYGTQRSDLLELPCLVVSDALRAALETTGLDNLAEDNRLVVISARVKAALHAAGLQGLVFQETADFNGYPVDTSKLGSGPDVVNEEPPL
jgi:hypothetical protein